MAKPTIALVPSTIGTKVYSVLPSDGKGDFTFTRATKATRINSLGLIEEVLETRNRLNYSLLDGKVQECPHLLLEPASTNLITYSEDISHSSWAKANGGTGSVPVVTANYSISPDGTQNADRVVFNLNNGGANADVSQISKSLGNVTSDSYTNSIWIKSNTESNYIIVITIPSGGFKTKIVTTQWQRFDVSSSNTTNISFRIRLRGDEGTSKYADVSIWGAQMEKLSYVTSYIPTTSASVTRNAETALGSGSESIINGEEGVLYANIKSLESDPNIYRSIYLNDTGATRYVGIRYNQDNDKIEFVGYDGSNFVSTNPQLVDSKIYNKFLVQYSDQGLDIYVNGIKITTLSNFTGLSASDLDELVFRSNNGQNFEGGCKELQYFDSLLSDAQLEELTSWVSFREMAEGQGYIIE